MLGERVVAGGVGIVPAGGLHAALQPRDLGSSLRRGFRELLRAACSPAGEQRHELIEESGRTAARPPGQVGAAAGADPRERHRRDEPGGQRHRDEDGGEREHEVRESSAAPSELDVDDAANGERADHLQDQRREDHADAERIRRRRSSCARARPASS